MIVTTPCLYPPKEKQAKAMTTTTQTGKYTSTNRPTLARNTDQRNKNKNKKRERKNKQTSHNNNINNKLKSNQIIQLLTVAPELVTLDCSLAHVLQTPNTQPYHS